MTASQLLSITVYSLYNKLYISAIYDGHKITIASSTSLASHRQKGLSAMTLTDLLSSRSLASYLH